MRVRFSGKSTVLLLTALSSACARTEAEGPGTPVDDRPGAAARALAAVQRAFPAAGRGAPDARLAVALPPSASGATHLAVADASGVTLDLTPAGLASVAPTSQPGATVYVDAAPDTDVVWATVADGVEELRVLRTPRASATARYRLGKGPGVAQVRVGARGDAVEVLDATGAVRLASAPMVAIDARGVRRPVHVELVGEVLETSFDPTGLVHPIVVDPTWSAVGPLVTARSGHTATALAGDAVLVVGGSDASGPLSTAELYDPVAKTWSATTPLPGKRSGHTATRLSSGKVLVVGGTANGSSTIPGALLFDPTSKTWSAAGTLTEGRAAHTATLLAGDKVVVAGGTPDFGPGTETSSAEIYDAATNAWTSAGAMAQARQEAAATILASGQVLVTGGRRGGGIFYANTDLFDPTTKAWTKGPDLPIARAAHTATLLSGGKVLLAGGRGPVAFGTFQVFSTAEVYDPTAKTYAKTDPMAAPRQYHSALALPLDRALVLGGDPALAERYDPVSNKFLAVAPLAAARAKTAAVLLTTNQALVVGGQTSTGTNLASAELLAYAALGTACTDGGAECGSGHCVDGVCCDAACTGACEACDVAGAKGTCTAVVGAPHGARTACPTGTDVCQAKHCDGKDRATCAAFADPKTPCAPAACKDGSETPATGCDGAGACAKASATPCAPFACGDTACKKTCAADTDCAGSTVCDKAAGKCVVASPTCTADGLASQPADPAKPPKDCAPLRCNPRTGNCFDRCVASDACAPGLACDPGTGACVAAALAEDGGCSAGHGRPWSVAGVLLGVAAGVAARRRRRPAC